MLLLRTLLDEALADGQARVDCVDAAVSPRQVGPVLAGRLRAELLDLEPSALAQTARRRESPSGS